MVQFLEERALRRTHQGKWVQVAEGGGGAREQKNRPQASLATQTLVRILLPLFAAVVSCSWHRALPVWDQFPVRTALFYWLLGSAHTINGVFISPFSCQYRTSQSDSVIIIKKAFFFFNSPHTHSLIQTTSGNFSLYHIKGKQI